MRENLLCHKHGCKRPLVAVSSFIHLDLMMRPNLEKARRLLCQLQDTIQHSVRAAQRRGAKQLTQVAAVTTADTIYGIDKVSEHAVLGWFAKHWPAQWPVELVMEGLEGAAVTYPRGTSVGDTIFKCILDPIDGTRGIMYDKRSAWSLAALAPQRGAKTNLSDIVVAAMTELPTSKAGFADQLSVVKGGQVVAQRAELATGRRSRFAPRPSQARELGHGFAGFAKFFPPGKTWLVEREAELFRALGGGDIFDDQYLSTGGQLYELLMGHDRFIADLRPLAFAELKLATALTCHPYDICTALIAQELGCVVTDPNGQPLRVPLDTTSAVAWSGYANRTLARRIAPNLRRILRARG